MHVRYPVWIRRTTAPGAEAFALLFTLESLTRALLATLIPLESYRLLGDALSVSVLFFVISLFGLGANLVMPWLVRRTARRWVYSMGALMLAAAPLLLSRESLPTLAAGMILRVIGTVALTVCLSLYIMDHIDRHDLVRSEPMRVFYSAGAWVLGPALGVYLATRFDLRVAYSASTAAALALFAYFWFLRLTETIVPARPGAKTPGPIGNLRRFLAQPRLRLAWAIAVGRNAWWGMFFVYTPIFAVANGLGAETGGLIVSVGSGFLFLLPLWGRALRRYGLRRVFTIAFTLVGATTLAAALTVGTPWVAAALFVIAAGLMTVLDAGGNVLFMRAVRKRERREMTPVYSTYRDAAVIGPPGVFALLLNVFALPAVFVASAAFMLGLSRLSRYIPKSM